jgi:hypothetical protein
MGFGLLLVFVLFPLFLLSLVASVLWLLLTKRERRSRVFKLILLFYAAGFMSYLGMVVVLLSIRLYFAPMKVERKDVIGTYHVDRNMFAGENADWQHTHFRMTITDQDTLVLQSRDLNDRWHTFKRPIHGFQGATSYLWRFPTENDSTAHHIISSTPVLHRQQWSFYYSFTSPRWGQIFFRKDDRSPSMRGRT